MTKNTMRVILQNTSIIAIVGKKLTKEFDDATLRSAVDAFDTDVHDRAFDILFDISNAQQGQKVVASPAVLREIIRASRSKKLNADDDCACGAILDNGGRCTGEANCDKLTD